MHVIRVTLVPVYHVPTWTNAPPRPVTRMPHARMSLAGTIVHVRVGTLATELPVMTLTSVPPLHVPPLLCVTIHKLGFYVYLLTCSANRIAKLYFYVIFYLPFFRSFLSLPQKSGSFTCTCNAGYYGNGFDCSDVDECSSNPCDANASCNNSAGGYTCSCNAGFAGNGKSCADVDECASSPCDGNASCTNEQGFWLSIIYLFIRFNYNLSPQYYFHAFSMEYLSSNYLLKLNVYFIKFSLITDKTFYTILFFSSLLISIFITPVIRFFLMLM